MIVFLYRPSPQVPQPSVRAARLCFEASRFNIYAQREQVRDKSVDLTWIFTQSLFMALNALLWTLSYPEIRKDHPKEKVREHLDTAQEVMYLASQRWPGVESALELYMTIIQACLKVYDGSSEASYVVESPAKRASSAPLNDVVTPPTLSTPSTVHSALSSTNYSNEHDHSSPQGYFVDADQRSSPQIFTTMDQSVSFATKTVQSPVSPLPLIPQTTYAASPGYQQLIFDPRSYNNPLPPPITYGSGAQTSMASVAPLYPDGSFFMGSMGDQYSQYLNAQFVPQTSLPSLDLEQQSELMRLLELDRSNGSFDPMQQPRMHFY